MIALAAEPAGAVIIFLKGVDQPIRGYLLRESERSLLIDQVLPDGSTQKRRLAQSEIEDLLKTVSTERLAELDPEEPDRYREYAEELAEKWKDPEARATAIRLFLIAADLEPQRLGRSCLLGMVPLASSEAQRRRFQAMAYLLDGSHNPRLLSMPVTPRARPKQLDPKQAKFVLRALRLLRQGKRREARTQARRSKMEQRLGKLTATITYEEFEQACEPICPHCERGRQTCPECQGRKFVDGRSCGVCRARGTLDCSHCGGDYRANPLPPSLLKRIVQLELDLLAAEGPEDAPPSQPQRSSWSQSVRRGRLAPLPPLQLETLTEFDPDKNLFRDGQWTSQNTAGN
jgi:hypothetical protein